MFALVGRSIESLYQVARGLKTVFKHTVRPPITKNFPDDMPDLPGHFRGRLALAVNPQTSEHLCISCLQCERVCPDKCIQITSHKSPETNKPELIEFKIDHGLCMFCGLCTEVCPTSCIINTNDFEMADYTRESLVYDLKRLTLSQDESAHYFAKKELPMPKPKPPKPAAKPAAPAAAAKPAEDKPEAKPEVKAEAKPQDLPAAPAPESPKKEEQ
ncbi:MAG: NADH-quinone oxidoreductase subunit I [Candidatus Obscuribacterales bacterium]|nr:NADH-quinone oxidoreductase subunit I [Candidatus Obscuribacterales bacterium]